jgi:hypothetical protein
MNRIEYKSFKFLEYVRPSTNKETRIHETPSCLPQKLQIRFLGRSAEGNYLGKVRRISSNHFLSALNRPKVVVDIK